MQGGCKSARVSRGNRARNLGNLDVNRILLGRATFAWRYCSDTTQTHNGRSAIPVRV